MIARLHQKMVNPKRQTDFRAYGAGRNVAKLEFPYMMSVKANYKPCRIDEFQVQDGCLRFRVSREGKKHPVNVKTLKFRFQTEHFKLGKVPAAYTASEQEKYLEEAETHLKELDDAEDASLSHYPI